MIIDLILDRKDDDELIAQGYTHIRLANGGLRPLTYDPRSFYRDLIGYGEIGFDISAAMDYGEEADVKTALCEYIIRNEYNPEICNYINSRAWLSA